MAIKIFDRHLRSWLQPLELRFDSKGIILHVVAEDEHGEMYQYEDNALDKLAIVGDISINESTLPGPEKRVYDKSVSNPRLRCVASEKAIMNGLIPKGLEDRKGTIIGKSRDDLSHRLIWDGSRTPTSMHKSFITILEGEFEEA
mgnify:FL=1